MILKKVSSLEVLQSFIANSERFRGRTAGFFPLRKIYCGYELLSINRIVRVSNT